jgi:hypothetical protein
MMRQEPSKIPAPAVPYGQSSLQGNLGLDRVLNENFLNSHLLRIFRIRVAEEPRIG